MISYSNKKTVRDYYWFHKKALIRCDFNVPIDFCSNKIVDDTRIVKALATINYILNNNGSVILISHLGRVREADDLQKYSLAIVAKRVKELLPNHIFNFIPETRGVKLTDAVKQIGTGEVIMLENTRFEDLPGKYETECNTELSQYWAGLADIFVNDAFGTIHRRHASTYGVAKYSSDSCIGLLVEEEIFNLEKAINKPSRPLLAIIGGAKVSDKINVIKNLLTTADYLILGGGMVFTFNQARNIMIGDSIHEDNQIQQAKYLLEQYHDKIILPIDFKTAPKFANLKPHITDNVSIQTGQVGLDIGPKTIVEYQKIIAKCHTIIWNGPMGVCEFSEYANGTLAICEAISKLRDVYSIVGGGDSIAAIKQLGYIQNFSHISTGGGALLIFFAGKKLSCLDIIDNQ